MLTTFFSYKVGRKWNNWIYSLPNCRKRRRQTENIAVCWEDIDVAQCCTRNGSHAVLVYGTNIQNARACVQCNYIDILLCRLTMWTASSQLWQWTRHRIVAVLLTGSRYVPQHWLVLPDVITWPKTERHTTIMWQVTSYTMLCGMGVLSPYTTTRISPGVCSQESQRDREKKTTSLAIIWKNAHRDVCCLLDTHFSLTPYNGEAHFTL
jgi:hypothetical protein